MTTKTLQTYFNTIYKVKIKSILLNILEILKEEKSFK